MYTPNISIQKMKALDTPTAILPLYDKLPFSQNKGHSFKVGPPHNPLLPERLSKRLVINNFL